ncbi:MAG: LysR substrate-binding domain-containing protein [Myxococcales bacterium]
MTAEPPVETGMDLNELLVFARVVQAGSFTGAARVLRMPKSTVSRKVTALEERVGAQLLQRTTRKLALTDVGSAFYEHCARIVAEIEQAERAVSHAQSAPRGRLRVTTPLTFSYIGPLVATFAERHPQVDVEIVCTDRKVDLLDEGFDLAIRAGPLDDSTLVARRVGTIERLVVAAPRYLKAHGVPRAPNELEQHVCLQFGAGRERDRWVLHAGGRTAEVPIRPRLSINEPDLLRAVTVAGAGVALLPDIHCAADLEAGRLTRLLEGWSSSPTPVHALYPPTRHLPPKVKVFVSLLRERWEASGERARPTAR